MCGPARSRPGVTGLDMDLTYGFLFDRLKGKSALLALNEDVPERIIGAGTSVPCIAINDDAAGALKDRFFYEVQTGVHLGRPDQHITAHWEEFDEDAVRKAIRRAIGNNN